MISPFEMALQNHKISNVLTQNNLFPENLYRQDSKLFKLRRHLHEENEKKLSNDLQSISRSWYLHSLAS